MDSLKNLSFDSLIKQINKPKQEEEQQQSVKVKKVVSYHQKRRISSELALEQELEWHFEKGASYHCVSFGDVDSLSYLRMIIKQQRLKYVLLSTWCMSLTDIKEIEKWIEKGYIKKIDFYVGEIFSSTYKKEWQYLLNLQKKDCRRVCVFKNHSKVMSCFGEKFDCVIESSANVNTNPRCEQTVITIDSDLALFYKDFYDQIKSFDKSFKDWKPYEVN